MEPQTLTIEGHKFPAEMVREAWKTLKNSLGKDLLIGRGVFIGWAPEERAAVCSRVLAGIFPFTDGQWARIEKSIYYSPETLQAAIASQSMLLEAKRFGRMGVQALSEGHTRRGLLKMLGGAAAGAAAGEGFYQATNPAKPEPVYKTATDDGILDRPDVQPVESAVPPALAHIVDDVGGAIAGACFRAKEINDIQFLQAIADAVNAHVAIQLKQKEPLALSVPAAAL